MATPKDEPARTAAVPGELADDLDMPAERRTLAKAYAAMLSATARKVSNELPFSADVDDFRRVLVTEAKP
jgi:hypothetical protein